MIILGIILLVIGFVAGVPILWTIRVVLLVIGVVLELLGIAGHAVDGRRHYYWGVAVELQTGWPS